MHRSQTPAEGCWPPSVSQPACFPRAPGGLARPIGSLGKLRGCPPDMHAAASAGPATTAPAAPPVCRSARRSATSARRATTPGARSASAWATAGRPRCWRMRCLRSTTRSRCGERQGGAGGGDAVGGRGATSGGAFCVYMGAMGGAGALQRRRGRCACTSGCHTKRPPCSTPPRGSLPTRTRPRSAPPTPPHPQHPPRHAAGHLPAGGVGGVSGGAAPAAARLLPHQRLGQVCRRPARQAAEGLFRAVWRGPHPGEAAGLGRG